MKPLLLALLLLTGCQDDCACGAGVEPLVLEEAVDLICLNHFHDNEGRLVFDQTIYYRWDGERFQVADWRLCKCKEMIPRAGVHGLSATWRDGDVLRRVRAGRFYETWTQHDPELVARDWLPKENRKGLRGPIVAPVRKRVDVLGWLKMWGGE